MNARDSMTTTKQPADVVRVKLSDNSIAYNVIARLDGQGVCFGCQDAKHADALAEAINQAAWIEKAV